jgi:hypothetical protein
MVENEMDSLKKVVWQVMGPKTHFEMDRVGSIWNESIFFEIAAVCSVIDVVKLHF